MAEFKTYPAECIGKAGVVSKRKTKCIIALCLTIALLFVSIAAVRASAPLVLDVSSRVVYHNIDADKVIDAYDAGIGNAANLYNGKYYAVVGYVRKTPANWNEFFLEKTEGETDTAIKCIGYLGDLSMSLGNAGEGGLKIKVLGMFEVSESSGLTLSVDTIDTEEKNLYGSGELWTFKNLNVINNATSSSRKLGNGTFAYNIPDEWSRVEEKLPNVDDGYMYKLNILDGTGKQECLFVFYVDKKYLKDPEDAKNTVEFERAVVRDIMGSVKVVDERLDILPWKFERDVTQSERDSDYANGFHYYTSVYRDSNNNDFSNHRVEFVFLPVSGSDDGLRVLLYVYPISGATDSHRDEILYVIRSAYMK